MLPVTRTVRPDSLGEAPIFAGLPQAMRVELASRCEPLQVPAHAWLFRQGDAADALYVVLSGRLEVIVESPEEAVIRILGQGATVGELSLLTGTPRSAGVRALRDTELLALTRADFVQLLENQPRFSLALTRILGDQLRVSRGLTVERPPLPATIAIVPLGPGLPARELVDCLARAMGRWHPVASLDRHSLAGRREHGLEGAAAELDRCERTARQVLLLGEEPGVDDPWTEFCTRQADRTLALVGEAPISREATLTPIGRERDVVCCNWVPDRTGAAAWQDALAPRATHLVYSGTRFEASATRIARRLAGRSVGVVLSGGGARALAHIGVLEELLGAGIAVDRVAGCSMGAFIGAQLAAGLEPDAIYECCREELVSRSPWSDYTVPVVSLLRGQKLREMLLRVFALREIQDLDRGYFCVSTDLISSELVIHDRGLVWPAVAASMCIPGATPPVVMDRRLLVDGGLIDNLPVEAMASYGEGPIVAVDVTANRSRRAGFARPGSRGMRARLRRAAVGDDVPRPGLRETMMRSILSGSRDTAEAAKRFADLVIHPDTSSIGLLAFDEVDRARDLGRQAARAALESTQHPLSTN